MRTQYYRQGGGLGELSIAGRLVICGKSVLQAGWWFVGSQYYRQAGDLWEVSIKGRVVICGKSVLQAGW